MLNVSQNSENLSKLGFFFYFTSTIKSPMTIILPYLLRYLFGRFDILPKIISMLELDGGLYTLNVGHLLF